MPNLGGLKKYRRKLLNGVVNSILFYGAPVWAPAMHTERTRRLVQSGIFKNIDFNNLNLFLLKKRILTSPSGEARLHRLLSLILLILYE